MSFDVVLALFEDAEFGDDHVIAPLGGLLGDDVYDQLGGFLSDGVDLITKQADHHTDHFLIEEDRVAGDIRE